MNQKSPRQRYKRPAEAITNIALGLVNQEDPVVGMLTPSHIKWLLMFTYHQFKVKSAILTFDFMSSPKRIFVTPTKDGVLFGVGEWAKLKFMLKWNKVEKDLPGYMKLVNFKIEFLRAPVETEYRIDPAELTKGE